MKLIIIGAPGAGKGTQAKKLSQKLMIPTISTGAVIRSEITSGTQLGNELNEFIKNGNLVPDEVVLDLIKSRLKEKDCENGYILDGFPRTLVQAEEFFNLGYSVNKVLNIEVPDDIIIGRLSGRRECPKCRNIYHLIDNPPIKENVCDSCGADLITRDDDKEDVIKNRLKVFHNQTKVLKDYYEKKNMLVSVVGKDDIEDTTKAVFNALGV